MIKLTQTVQKGGCAAKVSALELRNILSLVQFPPSDSQVLVNGSTFDDAAIYQISPDLALVQTLDFFTPILDSPRLFGAVAAANSISDVYAMGGEPKTAMAILAFPLTSMENDVIAEVLQGASDKIKEAQAHFVGGHSIDDDTLKFGLSVTGIIHPEKVWSNAKAQIGDHLILTKPLGTGTICAGLKKQAYQETELMEAIESMLALNRLQDLLTQEELATIHAATDITGFGLAGHAHQMALASHKTFVLNFHDLPLFSLTIPSLQQGFLTKAHRTNAEYLAPHLKESLEDPLLKLVLFDPQTSGGLLLCVSPDFSTSILNKLSKRFPRVSKIGEVLEKTNATTLSILP